MRIVFFILVTILVLFGDDIKKDVKTEPKKKSITILKIKDELKDIDEELTNNIWVTRYNNYLTYKRLKEELLELEKKYKKYSRWRGKKYKELSYKLKNKIKIKKNELSLIDEYKDSPIGNLIHPKDIDKKPIVKNPFQIIEAYSYITKLKKEQKEYDEISIELSDLLSLVFKKKQLLEKMYKLTKDKDLKDEIDKLNKELQDFAMVVDIVSTTNEVYSKKVKQIVSEVRDRINNEVDRSIRLVLVILSLFILSFLIKIALKKYIKEDDHHYTANKLVDFVIFFIIVMIVLFSYIDNASYLITFLGFASAGIAIALKDWFMSIFGWFVIMTSGAIRVGDRVKVIKNGSEVVGDVLDISLFKISVREDVTLTSYMKNRRTGRVFFIPNNYIFTEVIANYTFDGLKTVWDGIDIYITFDSNHKKAVEIAKEVANEKARGYTEFARKRLDKLKTKYVLRSSSPEPRVFSFVEPYGIVISTWYHTNSHATLLLRSQLSMEILDRFLNEDDIKIAYPTQTLRVTATKDIKEMLPGINTQKEGFFDSE